MNQYIITEEELLDTRSYIYHEDEVAFSRIESKVRSHPHQSERDKVLDDYCIIDLTYYVWGEAESDDVRLCQGKGCNYCGRYNEKLRQSKQGGD